MQSFATGTVTRSFFATFEPTGDDSRCGAVRKFRAKRQKAVGEAVCFPSGHGTLTVSPYSLFLETRRELFALFLQFLRHDAAQRIEKFLVLGSNLFLPLLVIDAEKFDDVFVLDVELIKIEIVRAGQPANGRLNRAPCFFAAIDDPFEHPHVLAETGPEKFPVRAFAKPVHVKNERRIGEALPDIEPMPEVIAD